MDVQTQPNYRVAALPYKKEPYCRDDINLEGEKNEETKNIDFIITFVS